MSRVIHVFRWITSDYTSWSTAACQWFGKYKNWLDIRVSNNEAVKNICSACLLREMGYGLQLMRDPRIVRLCDGQEVI